MLRALGVHVAGTTLVARYAIDLVHDAEPDLLVVGVATETAREAEALIRTVHEHAGPTIVALGDESDRRVVSSILAAGAVAFLRRPN